MLKKLKTYSKFLAAIMIFASSISSILTPSLANATSGYDSVVDKVNNIELYNSACTISTIDYSDNWAEEFISASSTLSYANPTEKANYINLFENKTYWGVAQQVSNTSTGKEIIMWWTDASTPPEINFQMDGSYPIAAMEKTGSGTLAWLGVTLQGSGASCYPIIYMRTYTTGNAFLSVASEPSAYSSLGSTIKPWRQSTKVNYPIGYAGELLNKQINGNAICTWGDEEITDIAVVTTDSMSDGSATLTSSTVDNSKYYSHYLTIPDDDYNLVVSCDGEQAPTPLIDSSITGSLNWGCTAIQLTTTQWDYQCAAI